ncbi:MAG: dTDP-4-dehydrorhamnose 3,5-epimerase family protein [Pseudomonadota bacterium]|nr:dTDP-4-dehydrorhamnose 3,5-epimerase family protein [Pseudomonadota bacterium]
MNNSFGIDGVHWIDAETFHDRRGSLSRLIDENLTRDIGFKSEWRQAFLSRTKKRNTIRGLHYQRHEGKEGKLISPVSGDIYWVAVDLRGGSSTYAKYASATISSDNNRSLLVEPGFAHGCFSISDETDIYILSSADPAPNYGSGIRWDDPQLAIDWPEFDGEVIISEAHADFPSFAEFQRTVGAL